MLGSGSVIAGFDAALVGMEVGEKRPLQFHRIGHMAIIMQKW